MHILRVRSALALAAFVALSAAGLPAAAETINMKADLKASNQVPPNASKGVGTVTVTYDTASKKLTWKGSVSGLTGNATAQHFHGPAEAGKNAGVVVPIPNLTQGDAPLTDAQAADLLAGRWYVNVHTAANPGGEIRGQVVR
jgi:Cu/Zn superoxide dismutase